MSVATIDNYAQTSDDNRIALLMDDRRRRRRAKAVRLAAHERASHCTGGCSSRGKAAFDLGGTGAVARLILAGEWHLTVVRRSSAEQQSSLKRSLPWRNVA